MSFIEEVSKDQNQQSRRKCNLSKALAKMDEDLKEEVTEAVNNADLTSASISRVLEKKGFDVGVWSVRQCRSTCKCGVVDR